MIQRCKALVGALCLFVAGASLFADQSVPETEYSLTLGAHTFDPLEQMDPMPLTWGYASQTLEDLRLVQFDGPIQESWINDMHASGLIPVQYIHPYTYITWAKADGRDRMLEHANVRWSGDFVNGYKVLPKWRSLSSDPIEARVMVYSGAETETVLLELATVGATRIEHRQVDQRFTVVSFVAPGSAFLDISKIQGVFTVQPKPTDGGLRSEMSNQVNAGNVDSGNMAFPGYRDWLYSIGLSGEGVTIAIVDGGSDETHPDLDGQFLNCSGQSCGGSQESYHGTHTAGIVGAHGGSESTDQYGFLQGQGVAPGASLIEQLYSPTYQQTGGMTLLMTESYRNGAIASSNSWGPSGSPQGYDIDTLEVDVAIRDAEPDEAGNQQFSYVLAIMNGNGGTSSQGSPDEAKNIFTIGSTNMRTGSGSQDPEINDVSSNSAHGPCLDGRTIPHMVAPGCQVLSTTPLGQYELMCGTSMACPQVAGGIALFVEQYKNAFGEEPTPALIKAAFTAAAKDLSGNQDADGGTLGHPFDSKQGWGRMDLPSVLANAEGSVRYYDAPVVLEATGDQWSTTVGPVDPTKPMKIMLVWTDALGHGLGGSTPAWNNDLDLEVSTGLSVYKGNNFGSQGWSTAGGSSDAMNNTEGVFLGPTAPSQATITVKAANLNSDGIPNEGDGIDQDFSVVCYNCAAEPDFSISVIPESQSICAPGEVAYSIQVGQLMGYELPVTLSAESASGIDAAFSETTVTPPATVTMSVTVDNTVGDGVHTLAILGSSTDGTTHETTASLGVSGAIPPQVVLTQPSNGASDVSIAPTFHWEAGQGVNLWRIQVSTTNSTGGIVHDASNIDIPSYALPIMLDSNSTYYWRVLGSNNCGDGDWSAWWSFMTTDVLTVLLVDDDDNSPDVRSYYEDLVTNAGLYYEVFDTQNSNNEPDVSTLQGYPLVIWFTGDEWGGFAGPGSAGEAALTSYIDGGGHLLLSSQDYLYDNQLTDFGSTYLGIAEYTSDVYQTTVTGAGELFGDFGTAALTNLFSNWTDYVYPTAEAEVAFIGDQGEAGIHLDAASGGGAIFLGFPIEFMSTSDQGNLMQTVLDWISDGSEPCTSDCNGDGLVNVADILAIIDAWGSEDGCDTNGDGLTNVVDLLDVVGSWGACP
ncbi:MAG: S8 family serine peptidase [Phycisphaerales bacterium]|nr:S8 family serine peptidase [Phycisphaerales bacterium]